MYSKRGTQTAILLFFLGVLWFVAIPAVIFPNMDVWKAQQEGEQEREWHFEPIAVDDPGEATWERKWGEDNGQNVVNQYDYFSDEQWMEQWDGSVRAEDVDTMHLNNVWFSVPKGGTRVFGYPVFSTELMAEGEWEAKEEWHDRDMTSRRYDAAFNDGMERTRELIREGYLQDYLEEYLEQYPELSPDERVWTLQFLSGGRTDREEDGVSWWDLSYRLVTTAENGETIAVGWLGIHMTIKAGDYPVFDDADYSMYPDNRGMWRLLGEGEADRGMVWINQLPDYNFCDEQAVKDFMRSSGAGFLLPEGADMTVKGSWRRTAGYWYDYVIWHGTTKDYELTFAVPLMPEGSGGWYMASRIRADAADKRECGHVLSVMMRTLRAQPYVYVVKEGDTLTDIAQTYGSGGWGTALPYYIAEQNDIPDPDLIYPGQQIALPEYTGKGWKAPR